MEKVLLRQAHTQRSHIRIVTHHHHRICLIGQTRKLLQHTGRSVAIVKKTCLVASFHRHLQNTRKNIGRLQSPNGGTAISTSGRKARTNKSRATKSASLCPRFFNLRSKSDCASVSASVLACRTKINLFIGIGFCQTSVPGPPAFYRYPIVHAPAHCRPYPPDRAPDTHSAYAPSHYRAAAN